MRGQSLLLAILFAALLAALAFTPRLSDPPALRHGTDAGTFDAARAKARLAVVLGDQSSHPADTATDDAVRDRLVAMLGRMGLTPIVRDQFACNALYKQRGVSCARVRNVIARLGPAAGKAILLNAHYDSTPYGPGAADDGIGVATLLEVAAVLKNRPLQRPVMLLFNEGEELGLVGARAFLADPLSRQVDSLINLEARGVTGPVNMFETSRPNGSPIALFRSAVSRPVANSLSTDVYRLMPNYTDVNSFAERGWLTLNLAPIGNETRYHSPGDTLGALDAATLQHMGDQTLALTRQLASGAAPKARSDRIFADIAGRWLMVMPLLLGAGLLALATGALALVAIGRRGLLPGFALPLGTMIGSGLLSWLALALIGAARHGMFWRAEPQWTLLAAYASAILVGTVLLAALARRAPVGQLRAAFWLVFAIVGALVGLAAPGAIVFFLVPPLFVLAGVAAARWWRAAEKAAAVAAILFLYLTWGEMLGLLQELLSNGPMWIFAPLGALIVLPVLIEAKGLVDAVRIRNAALLAGLFALAGWIAAAGAPAYSADRQQRFALQFVSDAKSGKSYWSLVNDGAPVPAAFWAAGAWHRGKLPVGTRERWLADAPRAAATGPGLKIESSIANGSERTIAVRLAANGWQRVLLIAPEDSRLSKAGADGFVRAIDQSEDGPYAVECFGRSCDGATLTLVVGKPGPLNLTLVGSRAGLPATAAALLAHWPRNARPQYGRNETMAFERVKL